MPSVFLPLAIAGFDFTMFVTVRFQKQVERDLAAWAIASPGTRYDRLQLLKVYIDNIRKELIEHRGNLPEARRVIGLEPTTYLWRYTDDLWIRYTVQTERSWFRRNVRIMVLRFGTSPPE